MSTAFHVADVPATLAWYTSIGFAEIARYANEGVAHFGIVSFVVLYRPGR